MGRTSATKKRKDVLERWERKKQNGVYSVKKGAGDAGVVRNRLT